MTDDEEAIEESTDEGEAVNNQVAPPAKKGQEILYKSSKDFYRAMAKQWGITCKMSDNCRCFDCQVTNKIEYFFDIPLYTHPILNVK